MLGYAGRSVRCGVHYVSRSNVALKERARFWEPFQTQRLASGWELYIPMGDRRSAVQCAGARDNLTSATITVNGYAPSTAYTYSYNDRDRLTAKSFPDAS